MLYEVITVNDSDHMSATDADVFVDSDSSRHAWPIWDTTKSGGGDTNATYTAGTDSCSNIDVVTSYSIHYTKLYECP